MSDKAKKEEEKLQNKIHAEAKKNFSMYTVQLFEINKTHRSKIKIQSVDFSINDEIQMISSEDESLFYDRKRIRAATVDNFLYSGKFNSVIGIEGLRLFRDKILEYIYNEEVNFQVTDGFLNDLILKSGLYYEYEYSPNSLQIRLDEFDIRTIYRYWHIKAKNISFASLEQLKLIEHLFASNHHISENDLVKFQTIMTDLVQSINSEFKHFLSTENKMNIESLKKLTCVS